MGCFGYAINRQQPSAVPSAVTLGVNPREATSVTEQLQLSYPEFPLSVDELPSRQLFTFYVEELVCFAIGGRNVCKTSILLDDLNLLEH